MVEQSIEQYDSPSSQLLSVLNKLQTQGILRPLDKAFALFIAEGLDAQHPEQYLNVSLLSAYLSASLGEQHSCIALSQIQGVFAPDFYFAEQAELTRYLQLCSMVEVITLPFSIAKLSCNKPIVLDGNSLYLQRYWLYEGELAEQILARASQQKGVDELGSLQLLKQLFSTASQQELDWQQVAVCLAARQMISFITGGPGTGKTTTVTKLLALLQGLARAKDKVLSIKLVAPTGKAAARLTESIAVAKLKLPAELQQNLPEQCQTIHRLLGARPLSPYFKANVTQPLHLDVLVVDEASMVDLPLMSKLFSALPSKAQVILLGDKDQLASVEAGSVLSDICAAVTSQAQHSGLAAYSPAMQQQLQQDLQLPISKQQVSAQPTSHIQDNLVMLQKSHRFSASSGIGQLATHINQGEIQPSITLLKASTMADVSWVEPKATFSKAIYDEQLQTLVLNLMPIYRSYFSAIKQGNLQFAFACLARQQVLCAQRNGPWGVGELNRVIQQELSAQGLITTSQDFYTGRPVILTRNDHNLKLFNGDIGIVMPDPANPSLTKVWFNMAEGHLSGFLPNRIPPHDTLYAMTIHKSQGSEFEQVHLCLPLINQQSKGRGLSRELLYTGLTRAKQNFTLYAQQQALQICLKQQCVRGSGLAQRLK
ncbi:MAG: exodeoxyribonuclease V subunit alpha [Paraglaciecola sp.]|uniref:exodeoxyribonuclease V subunit alpha n=1 Tax=Paraglaciecola sp. TaxID=1920173 RepID=UPI00273E9954|nr:exodeoxyribonuclease V subunit alpha [Paraglaciecola sp.]MDP5030527.1 exodeoxyribonuclease V subunit alpha [Paraglaciecola sp.]MDP5129585.1 exodeoxyribonuclease V subunit alpha [Paraglaciecola sp.]